MERSQVNEAQKYISTQNKPVIVFCLYELNWQKPDDYYREIYDYLHDKYSMIMFTDVDDYKNRFNGSSFLIEKEDIHRISGVSVFIVTDALQFDYPQRSFVIAFPHSFHGYYGLHRSLNQRYNLHFFDAYCSSVPQIGSQEKELKAAHEFRLNPKYIRRKRKAFYYTGTGCPRLATVRNLVVRQGEQPLDTLLYAPTGYGYEDGDPKKYMVPKYGGPFLHTLAAAFPNYKIIFRPSPWTAEHPFTKGLMDEFRDNPHVTLSNWPDHAEEFVHTALLITDYSNIGETFSFSTLRPELCMTLEATVGKPIMTGTGLTVSPEDDMVSYIQKMLDCGQEFWSEHIKKQFSNYTIDPTLVLKNIEGFLDAVIQGKRPDNTAIIGRDSTLPAWTEIDYIKHIIIGEGIDPYLAADFYKEFPENGLALAILCYAKARENPKAFIPDAMKGHIERMGTVASALDRYEDVTPEVFSKICNAARYRFAKDGKTTFLSLVDTMESTLRDYWEVLAVTPW